MAKSDLFLIFRHRSHEWCYLLRFNCLWFLQKCWIFFLWVSPNPIEFLDYNCTVSTYQTNVFIHLEFLIYRRSSFHFIINYMVQIMYWLLYIYRLWLVFVWKSLELYLVSLPMTMFVSLWILRPAETTTFVWESGKHRRTDVING